MWTSKTFGPAFLYLEEYNTVLNLSNISFVEVNNEVYGKGVKVTSVDGKENFISTSSIEESKKLVKSIFDGMKV